MKKVEPSLTGDEWQMDHGDTVIFETGVGLTRESFYVTVTKDNGLQIRTTWGRLMLLTEVANSMVVHSTRTKS